MLVLTDKECDELEKIIDGYVVGLNSLNKHSVEYDNLKELLDNKLCGLDFLEERKICRSEINLGNVIIKDDMLTCIFDNVLHKFRMVNRKAANGEYAYILKATECVPFDNKYIGRCFRVGRQPTEIELEWVNNHVCIIENDSDYSWCLYDDQYVVLEELK